MRVVCPPHHPCRAWIGSSATQPRKVSFQGASRTGLCAIPKGRGKPCSGAPVATQRWDWRRGAVTLTSSRGWFPSIPVPPHPCANARQGTTRPPRTLSATAPSAGGGVPTGRVSVGSRLRRGAGTLRLIWPKRPRGPRRRSYTGGSWPRTEFEVERALDLYLWGADPVGAKPALCHAA
jgi:hypothetical protein